MSRRSDPGPVAAAPIRLDQYLTDLANYCYDVDRASWLSLNVNGPAWEALGYIAENGGQTATAVSYQFSERRGYSAKEYTTALDSLEAQGWLALAGDTPKLYPVWSNAAG